MPAEMDAFGIYLHIPFCLKKCPYCDFYSTVADDPAQLAAYPELLIRELECAAAAWKGPATTLFFGGGTPSLLPAEGIARIVAAVRDTFGLTPEAEISLEANPGTVTPPYLAALRRAGINRLSLGAQALSDRELQGLGRIHSHGETIEAIRAARAAGFANLSLDLIYGRPGQGLDLLEEELDRLLELEPQHLSCYALSIEEGTPFARRQEAGTLELPGDEAAAEAFRCVHQRLEEAGFKHYEISNFAQPGRECRHNLGYWQRRPYLGLGPGAHSLRPRNWGERYAIPGDLELYRRRLAAGAATAELLEVCDQRLAMAETLYLGLRTATGVSDAAFAERFGCTISEAFPEAVGRCTPSLRHEQGYWRFDLNGWLLYDHLIAHFL